MKGKGGEEGSMHSMAFGDGFAIWFTGTDHDRGLGMMGGGTRVEISVWQRSWGGES